MDVRQTRYFIAVAEELNFTRAAVRCGISQPPLSRAIALLELEVGARLFDRDKHRVSLTPVGLSLYDDARHAIESLDLSMKRARQFAKGEAGKLTIAIGGTMSYSLIPNMVARFRAKFPKVEFEFRALAIPQQLHALRMREIDIGVVRLPIFDNSIDTLPVHREKTVMAVPDALAAKINTFPVRLSDFQREVFVTYQQSRGFGFHADLLVMCRALGFEPNIGHQVPTTEAVLSIVGCGEGVALVPASAMCLHVSGVSFIELDVAEIPERMIEAQFGLAWLRDHATKTLLNFVDLTRDRRLGG